MPEPKKAGGLAIVLAAEPKKAGGKTMGGSMMDESEPEDDGDLEVVAGDLIDAVKANDVAGVASALRAAFAVQRGSMMKE